MSSSSNFFGSIINKNLESAFQSVSHFPYHADQQTIGRYAQWVTDGICRLVGHLTPTRYKNASFKGLIRRTTLLTAGFLGSPELTNINSLKARVWFTKPLEYLQVSCIDTARKIYDLNSQKYHAEQAVPEVVKEICDKTKSHFPDKMDDSDPIDHLEKEFKKIIEEKVFEDPLTMAEVATNISRAVLPVMFEQGARIFIAAVPWCYWTNSPFVSTFATVSAFTASASFFGNRHSFVQVGAHGVLVASTLYFSNNSQWISSILSVGTLAIWWGLIANGKTAELTQYKPPESANQVENLVHREKSAILEKVDGALNDVTISKTFEADIDSIKFPKYPFMPFVEKPIPSSESSSGKRAVHFEDKGKERVKEGPTPWLELENNRKKFERKYKDYKERPEYWELKNREYKEKARYYRTQGETEKRAMCICHAEEAHLNQYLCNNEITLDEFEGQRKGIEKFLGERLAEHKGNKHLIKILNRVKTAKHPLDV